MLGNNNQSNNKLFILKIKTKDAEKKDIPPVFAISEKVDDKWQQTKENKDVCGDLVKIETEKREWEGNEYDTIKVYLEDKEVQETYLLDLRQNLLSRNIFNTLLGLKDYSNVSISLYENKKGDKTYPAVSVKQAGARTEWKFKLEDLPKIKKVKVGKKEVTDSTELDQFFIEKLNELGEALKKQPAPKTVEVEDENGNKQDIPF